MNDQVLYPQFSPSGTAGHLKVDLGQGLSPTEVQKRQAKYGLNRLDASKIKPKWQILGDQLKSLLAALLVAAAILSYVFDDVAEALAILVVVMINTAIGFWAENKATRSMAALRKMARTTARVRRLGQTHIVPAEDLVPGDILLLDAGDIVAADAFVVTTSKLQCDESLLTGESIPVDKTANKDGNANFTPTPNNMVFKGTAITRGSCLCLVAGTGKNTQLGEIATLADSAQASISPLEKRLEILSQQLLIAVSIVIALLVAGGILAGNNPLLIVKTGIALAVAAIPEGLPIVATMALARGMWKLADRHALIERLSAIETLGSVSVILTDKTGTLTENKMAATILSTSDAPEKNGFENPEGVAARCLRICALCFSGSQNTHLNDPMETALVRAADEAGFSTATCEQKYPRVAEDAFDPSVRMMATIHKVGDKYLYLIKGAPEAVLAVAHTIGGATEDTPMIPELRDKWLGQTNKFAQRGLRVLALAEKTTLTDEGPPYEGLTFLGLVCLEDPPRRDAAHAVTAAHAAGVRVIMATGDNAATASNIAAMVGITDKAATPAIEGDTLSASGLVNPDMKPQILTANVFARMTPRQKLDLITLHQENGAVVAMTGDGVNDAPALKKADVGIAMGIRGTEVAKEAAAMILRDDAFASIILAIQQGRVIFANIRKFVIYLMSCNLSEVLVVTVSILAGWPLPLLPLQILFLNLVTDVFPALALGFGRADSEILTRPPRPKHEGLLQPRHWQAIVAYAALMTAPVLIAYGWALQQSGTAPDYANTVAFLSLALGQLWHVFNMRSRKAAILNNQVVRNPFLWAAILLCLLILLTALYWPPFASTLRITPPDAKGWAVIAAASILPTLMAQIGKLIPLRSIKTTNPQTKANPS